MASRSGSDSTVRDSSSIMFRKATKADCARAGNSCRSIMAAIALQRLSPFSRANASTCSTVVRPMPRAGVLITRSKLTESWLDIASFR